MNLKKLFITVFLFCLFMVPLFAEDTDTSSFVYPSHEETVINLTDMPVDESMHYAFLYGYQAILENLCNGALLSFDIHDNYIAGYLTPKAPDYFCVRISPKTITTVEPITKGALMAMYYLLGDRSSYSALMASEEEVFVACVMFEPVENMVVTPLWFNQSQTRLENAVTAQGLNIAEFYEIMLQQGYSKDSLVASVEKGTDPTSMAQDALRIKYSSSDSADRHALVMELVQILFSCIAITLIIVAIILVVNIIKKKHGDSYSTH